MIFCTILQRLWNFGDKRILIMKNLYLHQIIVQLQELIKYLWKSSKLHHLFITTLISRQPTFIIICNKIHKLYKNKFSISWTKMGTVCLFVGCWSFILCSVILAMSLQVSKHRLKPLKINEIYLIRTNRFWFARKFIENCNEMFDELDEILKCVGQLAASWNYSGGEFAGMEHSEDKSRNLVMFVLYRIFAKKATFSREHQLEKWHKLV